MKRLSILLITVALIAGMAGCTLPSQNLEIRTWNDLDAIMDNLRGNHILMNDLDSTTAGYTELASPTANQGKGWQPIGTEDDLFTGTFDGQGYEIRDLFIYRPDESDVGLFGVVDEGGVIENVGVVNGNVTGYDDVGGLVGYNNKGTVTDSYSSGSVTGNGEVGSLVGYNDEGSVSNSYSSGSVIGNNSVGGLVGYNFFGTVTDSYSSGSVTGQNNVGGLVGWNRGTMSNSYSTGSVTGNYNVGGLAGKNSGTASTSYSSGSVTGDDNVGGMVGENTGTVSNSYSTGNVTGDSSVGGLVGDNPGTVSDSFWDTQTSGQDTSDGGSGKTTEGMTDFDTFDGVGWDITTVDPGETNPNYTWNIVDTVTYPFQSWESVV